MKYQEISEALTALLEDIKAHTTEPCDGEARRWLMAAALKIWAGNELVSSAYIDALSVLTDKTYTTAQVMTALNCANGRDLIVPEFFKSIVRADLTAVTSKSRTIVDSVCRFLAMLALVNGDFTIEEAHILRSVSDLLLEYCDREGVIPGVKREIHRDMVTSLKKESYYQAEPKEKPSADEVVNPLPGAKRPESTEETPSAVINFNVSVVSEPGGLFDPERMDNDQKNTVTEGVSVKTSASEDSMVNETLDEVLAELHGLVGLDKVKNDVQSLLNFIRVCQMRTQRGMKVPTISYHLVFTGNPGTGKTTVARLVAKLYYLMGILPQGQLVETDRSGLVAGYLGQTAIKTQKVIQKALGGVLFIDEAYSLANDDDDSYGKEAIETLLKAMEDHRDELVVIVAGYDELMHQFIDSNPGLRSRFNKYFHFPDYNGDDLLAILKRFCKTNGYTLAETAEPHLKTKLDEMYENREEHFGNARSVRNLFEHAINHQANRLATDLDITDQELAELTLDDILAAMEEV